MSDAGGQDPYLDPENGVLRNRLGITDPDELAAVEAALSASRLVDVERHRLSGAYDLAHLQAFHRYIFADVYDWAGQLRTVAIAKGRLVLPASATGFVRCRRTWQAGGRRPPPRPCSGALRGRTG